MSSDISRRSSRQPLVLSDDATSLTSFPDPAESASPPLHAVSVPAAEEPLLNGVPAVASPRLQPAHEPLNGLLDAGPSMFDEPDSNLTDPQSLSAASTEVLQQLINYRGAVELVRHLSALLAERDAHVTALTRLAEEYRIPANRIAETAHRARRTKQRHFSLATAALESLAPKYDPGSSEYAVEVLVPETGNGTIRGLTKLFGGGGKRKDGGRPGGSVRTSSHASSTRSVSGPPPRGAPPPSKQRTERPKSIDVLSITSAESAGWTSTITDTIKGIGGLSGGGGSRNENRPSREPVEMSTRHDKDQLPPTLSQLSSNDPQESEWNKFLVRLMKSREQAGEEARSGELVGASRWGHEGASGKQKLDVLTRLVVGGIPMRLRHPIWMEQSNTYAIMQPDAYAHYLGGLPPRDREEAREIDAILKDVPRTLTSKYDYYAERGGYERLKRVLIAFVSKYPGLGYTQGLNMIAGYLLLAIPDESDAFWVLCNMVDDFFPPDYFAKTTAMSAPISDNVVLRQYVRELMPKLSDKMTELEVDAEHTVPLSWFLTAFASVLPETVLLRIWDVWLCLPNQKTFLFNIALTLLSQHSKGLLECQNQGEYFAYMSNEIQVSEDAEKINDLIRQAFLMRKKLEQVELRRALEMKKLKKHASTDALFTPDREEPATTGA